MSLDFPAAADALWQITSATGVKPEYILPCLWLESNFNPGIQNQQGAPYYGISQNGAVDIQSYAGVTPQVYLTWPASQQLATVVKGYLGAAVHSYGVLRSATRVYQSIYLPATLATARSLSDVIASAANDPNGFYKYNSGLDVNHDGVITVADLATNMKRVASTPQVQQAITATYAAKDSSILGGDPTDVDHIVYGDDFSTAQKYPVLSTIAISLVALGVGGGIGYAWETGALKRAYRRLVR